MQQTVEERTRVPAGADPRAQLLAGLPVTERRPELAGLSTAVLEGGDGPPIVLLHGPGEFAAKWLRVIPELVTSHRVVAPDLPGHGADLGRHDRANRLQIAEAASARYGWPLHVIEDCADDPARDQPEAFLRALRAALETVPAEEAML